MRAGADKEAASNTWATPLIVASTQGHLQVAEALVRAGANKEAKDEEGCTPLIAASGNGHLPVAEALVRAGADVTAANVDGRTAEQCARKQGTRQSPTCCIAEMQPSAQLRCTQRRRGAR